MRTLNWRRIPRRKILNQDDNETTTDFIGQNNDGETSTNNIWFMIANENKTVKEDKPVGNRSASKIREMLESVRRRMAAVTVGEQTSLSQDYIRKPKDIMEVIDFDDLENLFRLNIQSSDLNFDSPNSVRRLSTRTNVSSDSVISSSSFCLDSSNNGEDDDDPLLEIENILDPKKSLNVNIFLKQIKSSSRIIEQINKSDTLELGKDRLETLIKLVPDEDETTHLMKFYTKNRQHRLPVAERFLLQLILEVPNVKLRLKFMLLQEEYRTDLEAIEPEIEKLVKAVDEIKHSKMLRDLLNLVLTTGNYLNTGGYAADAAGFGLDCLERLNEIKSNKAGVTLIHYVADKASKLGLLDFLSMELPHVEQAFRVCIESIKLDLCSMLDNIKELERDLEIEARKSSNEDMDQTFLMHLSQSLIKIRDKVESLQRSVTCDLEETRKRLADYLCEDRETFKLAECFHHIMKFSVKLKGAAEDNERRQRLEVTRMYRSTCSLRRSNTIGHRTRQSVGSLSGRLSPVLFSKRQSLSLIGANRERV